MVRVRAGTIPLGRLLDELSRPVYVLDAEGTIVFANRACLDWLGHEADAIQGQPCRYHSGSEPGGPAVAAAGLCPPPEALAGQDMAGIVACATADGRLHRRRARFVPLASGDESAGLIALVEPVDLSQGEAMAAERDVSPADDSEAARLHERLRSFRQYVAARYRIDSLVGDSLPMRRARTQVELAAQSRTSVLIVGPPGSGRQHTGRAIHYAAAEAGGSFVPVACSVLEEELIVSTVAAAGRRSMPSQPGAASTLVVGMGPSSMATQASPWPCAGTLLLADVDTLSPQLQAEVARLLGVRGFPLRIIATSQQPLVDLARGGKYREDLAQLLSTIVIELPPLAQRRGDLPLLLQLFLEEANAGSERQLSGFTPEAIDCLAAYAWPGNVDELVRLVREAHRKAEGPRVGVADLPEQIHLAATAAAHPRRVEETIVLDEFLTRVEKELLHRAMVRAKGNKTKAASLLGISRARLIRRLAQLGIQRP